MLNLWCQRASSPLLSWQRSVATGRACSRNSKVITRRKQRAWVNWKWCSSLISQTLPQRHISSSKAKSQVSPNRGNQLRPKHSNVRDHGQYISCKPPQVPVFNPRFPRGGVKSLNEACHFFVSKLPQHQKILGFI